MKAFRFRLGQALRWREQNVLVEKTLLAATGTRIAAVKNAQAALGTQLAAAARDLVATGGGVAFHAYEGFLRSSRCQVQILATQESAAKNEYAAAVSRLLESTRKVRLLESLRDADRQAWQRASDREMAGFADEAFLARHSSLSREETRRMETLNTGPGNGTIGLRTGA